MLLLKKTLKHLSYLFIAIPILSSCTVTVENDAKEMQEWENEIRKVEGDFAQMVADEGLARAFGYFAADDAVIKRRGVLIKGKRAIEEWYMENSYKAGKEELSWEPDLIEVSRSGDLAYTYGGFVNTRTDSLGEVSINEGSFHTVWKRQVDGTWKFVWD